MNATSVRFPNKYANCDSLSDVEAAINSGDFYVEWARVIRVKRLNEEDFDDFSNNLNGEFSWADISSDLPFAGDRGDKIAYDAIEIVSSHNKRVFVVVHDGKVILAGVE
jgi:hypothetical protein